MTWLYAVLGGGIITLLVILIIKVKKISSLEKENERLTTYNASLTLRVNTLNEDLKASKQAYKEIQDVEKRKEEEKEPYQPPPAGDSNSRLDLLNQQL